MANEQAKTLEALQTAIQMEIDGREFYLKASRESSNELGKKLLETLAAEEDTHQRNFQQIYDAIRDKKAWPDTGFQADGGRTLRTIFAKAIEEIGSNTKPLATELDAVLTAIDMESKTYDFYKAQLDNATYSTESEFYQALSTQEREHQLVLLDYYEYLKDPTGWFVQKEHHSLDGG